MKVRCWRRLGWLGVLGGVVRCWSGDGIAIEKPALETPKIRKLYAPGLEPTQTGSSTTGITIFSEKETMAEAAAILSGANEGALAEESYSDRHRRRRPRVIREKETGVEGPQLGPLTDRMFQSVISDWTGMKRCLERHAKSFEPGRSGAIELALTISRGGQVIKSEVVKTSNAVARILTPCLERQARRISFPKLSKPAQKVAKFVF
ncbi:MAG: hypothetical protein KTR25_20840 [Myxococcales bacterium]|nr:hypothetical protein [Myxococcales bacterium]